MCEICQSEGKNSIFLNGPKDVIMSCPLYKVYKGSVANVKLCYVHSIELFIMGERRFLREHLSFAKSLASRTKRLTAAESPFGF
jgi:hypothetical protein